MADADKFGTVTYQGIPCVEGSFTLTPGMTADSGSVVIVVKAPHKMTLEVKRPMFHTVLPAAEEPARFTMVDSVIDGASFTLYAKGTLVFTSPKGDITLHNIYVKDEGVVEESSFLAPGGEDRNDRISFVRLHLCDERMWWGRRGFIFGTFNKVGSDSKHIAATGVPGTSDGRAFTLPELIDIGLASLCTHPERGEIKTDLALEDFQPINKNPRFQNPLDFLTDLLGEIRLLLCRQIDGVVDFCTLGAGQDPDRDFIPKELLLDDRVILGHNYGADANLLYAQYPTTEEVEIEFPGDGAMVLPDPRTMEFVPWREALPYYGIGVEDFKKIPMLTKDEVTYASRFTKVYMKSGFRPDDKIPTFIGRLGGKAPQAEAHRRAQLLVQHAFKAFRIPKEKMHLLPFEDALLSTDVDGPLSPICRVKSFTYFNQTEDQLTFGIKMSRRYWVNAVEAYELYAEDGDFSLQGHTGMVFFHKGPMGKMYGKDTAGKRLDPPLATPTRVVVPGVFDLPRESMYLDPPESIYLLVAHTLRGTRDLRSYPGRRSKFPAAVAEVHLQERSSPEDHFMVAYDKDGKKMDVDDADRLYPEMHQMVGMRKMYAIRNPNGSEIRDERLLEEAGRIIKPLVAQTPTTKGRHRKGYGLYNIKVDGVVTQVVWSVDRNGVATTEILTGCLRTSVSRGNLSIADRSTQVQASAEPQGTGSETVLNRIPG